VNDPFACDEAFYAALGRFIQMYGKAEDHLNATIARLATSATSGTWGLGSASKPQAIIYALIGSQRLQAAKDTFKRLLRVLDASIEMRAEVDRILAQFGEIQYARDMIAHHGLQGDGDTKKCSPSVSKEAEKQKTIWVSRATLLKMARDLSIIPKLLDCLDSPYYNYHEREHIRLHGADDIFGPWQYKSTQLKRPAQE